MALITALLFYFGWVRTDAQAEALGFDASVLGLSTQDYVLKSINVLYLPGLVLLVLSMLLTSVHERVMRSAVRAPRERARLLAAARWFRWSWLLWTPAALALMYPSRTRDVAVPIALTGAVVMTIYGECTRRRLSADLADRSLVHTLMWVALALAVFWDAERVATAIGRSYAADIAGGCSRLTAGVVVYSQHRLGVSVPGVQETKIATGDEAYHYRYEGLLLLERSGQRYVLVNRGWNASTGRVLALEDSSDLRLEFRPPCP